MLWWCRPKEQQPSSTAHRTVPFNICLWLAVAAAGAEAPFLDCCLRLSNNLHYFVRNRNRFEIKYITISWFWLVGNNKRPIEKQKYEHFYANIMKRNQPRNWVKRDPIHRFTRPMRLLFIFLFTMETMNKTTTTTTTTLSTVWYIRWV